VILLKHCIDGLRAHEKSIREVMQRSLMPVTAPAPKIGYDNAAKSAHAGETTLQQETLRLGFVSWTNATASFSRTK